MYELNSKCYDVLFAENIFSGIRGNYCNASVSGD